MKVVKKLLVFLWNKLIDFRNFCIIQTLIIKDNCVRHLYKTPSIKSIDETLEEIINKKASVCRYGDGEFKLIKNKSITFQEGDVLLSNRLKEILLKNEDNFLVCLPDIFKDLSYLSDEPKSYWRIHNAKYRVSWYEFLDKNKVYYNSFISRFYYPFKDKSKCSNWLSKLKLLWEGKEVVIIEGSKSRLGIGNDLFDNTSSIERILVPEENAFFKYNQILEEAKKIDKSKLILLAIGPTATVLAYDLYNLGYQAIDIGHVDIEYEWYLRKAKNKIGVENKYVCEAGAGKGVGEIKDKKYLSQIRAVIS
ncbi:SP_1767 family glycosyltransferase [Neobacillus sp. BF23-41]|uniref:SP_1767 family glycosyltransferase n=1 Tax=Neobacillus sp. BF23-41 TaxID=3240280 RepID=UPI0034E45A29